MTDYVMYKGQKQGLGKFYFWGIAEFRGGIRD